MYIGIDPLGQVSNDRLESRSHSQIEFFNELLTPVFGRLESVFRLPCGSVCLSLLGVFFRRHAVEGKVFGVFGDLEQEGNAPAATGAGAETLRHPAGSTRPDAPAVVDQLPQGNMVAVANVVVEIHGHEVVSS